MPTLDTAAALSLQAFAIAHTSELDNALPFAHLVTAALQGEEWAVARLADISFRIDVRAMELGRRRDAMLEIIRATDCTRPDGAIARSIAI